MDLELLIQKADVAAKQNKPRPNFPIPQRFINDKSTTGQSTMQKRDSEKKGMGWYAKHDIEAGTFLLISKPLAMVMGWEEEEEEELDGTDDTFLRDEDETNTEEKMLSKRNTLLVIRLANAIKVNPKIWFEEVSTLFPRNPDIVPPLVLYKDTGIRLEMKRSIDELATVDQFRIQNDDKVNDLLLQEIRLRLPLIVRYNALSVETSPELFVYPNPVAGYVTLSATALYGSPSYFNHHHKPNVCRWAIGDIIFFVTNQFVKSGTELCISYIENELLCESRERRSHLLEMDFQDNDDTTNTGQDQYDDDTEKELTSFVAPIIDIDVQEEIMNMNPLARLDEINDLLVQATGNNDNRSDDDEKERDDSIEAGSWFKCDEYQLRILLALTHDSLGQASLALEQWEKCIAFTERNLPPADENSIAIRVQAALCAMAANQESVANEYATSALEMHSIAFGGGVRLFRRRYAKEMELHLRPESNTNAVKGINALNTLWPI